MERCTAAHQLVTRGRAGKCGNAGARCYAHTMLDMLSICSVCWICSVFLLRREKEVLMRLDRLARVAGSMSPATGVHVKVYLNLIICPHYMTAAEIAGGVKMVQIMPTCKLDVLQNEW